MNYAEAFSDLMILEEGTSEGRPPFGITQSAWDAYAPSVPVDQLTRQQAYEFAFREYWLKDSCEDLPGDLGFVVFQAAYNCGTGEAARWLQQAVGVTTDGVIGPVTLAAINRHPVDVTIKSFLHHQQDYYDMLEQRIPSDRQYADGWHNRILRTMRMINIPSPIPNKNPTQVTIPAPTSTVIENPPISDPVSQVVVDHMIQQTVSDLSKLPTEGNMQISVNQVFWAKVITGVLAAGIWAGMVYTGHDTSVHQKELLLGCQSWVTALVGHLITKKS